MSGCVKIARCCGLCPAHYQRQRLGHPDPTGSIERVSRKIDVDRLIEDWVGMDTEECIIWPFYRGPKGYGRVTDDEGVGHTASRYVCMKVKGDAPGPNYDAAHECGNGHIGCVNPKHISWKTKKLNALDKKIHNLLPDRPPRLPKGAIKNRRLRVEDVISIKARITSEAFEEIAQDFDVPRITIWRIAKGRSHSSVATA